jgi:hypothetical protein
MVPSRFGFSSAKKDSFAETGSAVIRNRASVHPAIGSSDLK